MYTPVVSMRTRTSGWSSSKNIARFTPGTLRLVVPARERFIAPMRTFGRRARQPFACSQLTTCVANGASNC